MKIKKLILGLLITLTIPTLVSCGNSKKKAAEKITTELNNRYGKNFIVDSVGGSFGTSDDSTIKAWCYEENNKDEMFKAAIKKDFSLVTDEYQALIMEKKLEESLKYIGDDFFDEVFVNVYLGNIMTSNNNEYDDFADYFKENEKAVCSLELFVKTNKEIDKEYESQRISDFLERYSYLDLTTNAVAVFYVHDDVFEKMNNEFKDIENEFEYYGSKEKSYNYVSLDHFKQEELNFKSNEIKDKFKW